MHQNLYEEGKGSFSDDTYWSSSKSQNNHAQGLYFGSGSWYSYPKFYEFKVRAVKAFLSKSAKLSTDQILTNLFGKFVS